MIFIVVRFRPKDDYLDRFPDEVDEFTAATRNEPGNLFFDWSRNVEDPSEYVLVEGFRDRDAGQQHVTSEHFEKFIAEAPTLLASTPLIISQEIDADGWSEMGEMKVG
ncbi:antibiotic biosynthesis monooxygenase [Mycobacteriaceae bacterium 1482268.1]|nr:antibiotic biosynthesis monooxygenase [Mycobacteriaceae bacterium 1482268.1]